MCVQLALSTSNLMSHDLKCNGVALSQKEEMYIWRQWQQQRRKGEKKRNKTTEF